MPTFVAKFYDFTGRKVGESEFPATLEDAIAVSNGYLRPGPKPTALQQAHFPQADPSLTTVYRLPTTGGKNGF